MTLKPIPLHSNYDWQQVELIDIFECNEKLVEIPNIDKLNQIPIYYDLKYSNAIDLCLARSTVVNMLLDAADLLPSNIGITVLDGWRPRSLQVELQDQVREDIKNKYPQLSPIEQEEFLAKFVAPTSPSFVSPHMTGGSVDVTLFDKDTGNLLNMGSKFDEPTERSYTRYYEYNFDDINACYNRRLLHHIMTKVGFSNLPTEWWHYDYGNQLWAFYSNKQHAIYNKIEWVD